MTYDICINENTGLYGCQKFPKDLSNPVLGLKVVKNKDIKC